MLTYCNYFKIYTCYHFIYAVYLKTNTMSHVNPTGGNLGKWGRGGGGQKCPVSHSVSERQTYRSAQAFVSAGLLRGRPCLLSSLT